MTAFEKLLLALPALQAVGPQMPYVRLRTSDQKVVADIEYRADEGEGQRLQVAIVERAIPGSSPQAIAAGVFDLATGALLRFGPTVSTATSPVDQERSMMELLACVGDLQADPDARGR